MQRALRAGKPGARAGRNRRANPLYRFGRVLLPVAIFLAFRLEAAPVITVVPVGNSGFDVYSDASLYVGYDFQQARVTDGSERSLATAYCWQQTVSSNFVKESVNVFVLSGSILSFTSAG